MGNCTSGARKKTKVQGNEGQAGNDTDEKEERSSAEDVTYTTIDHGISNTPDVTYTTIDHGNSNTPAVIRDSQDDCDYAIVNIPSKQNSSPETKTSPTEDCGDDYVLMG